MSPVTTPASTRRWWALGAIGVALAAGRGLLALVRPDGSYALDVTPAS